jgi:nucleoside-diphosphate-sugar epimerase
MPPAILLGLGFTTRRLALRLLCRGMSAYAVVRDPGRFAALESLGLHLDKPPRRATLIHTIPPLAGDENREMRRRIRELAPKRVIYISSTSVYGVTAVVDETTPALPADDKGRRRIEEEEWLSDGPWETMIVRAAAIYGPGRGIHVRVRDGRLPRTEPGGITSRIHADDLAAVLEAAALSPLTGAWPLADDYPCPTAEIAAWCGGILRKELAPPWRDAVSVAGRKVDGRKVRELVGVDLVYPEYQSGILASLAREAAEIRRP